MRPYWAIIRDSFHEALVSRVLWILLLLTTLFLLALVPLGFMEQAASFLRDDDFLNRDKLVEKIVAAGKSSQPSPGLRIWELLDDSTRQSLERETKDRFESRMRFGNLVEALQKMIVRRDFYRESDFDKSKLPASARTLYAKGLAKLPDDELARFNRLLLEAAFPDEIAPSGPKQVQVTYFNWELGLPLPVDPSQMFPAINQVLVVALSYLMGVAGVFVAVLVTASMIPQTFEAGSVDLLLSKPVFRSALFLAKFVGGCAFIAINAAYFIGGLWLILGLRFGFWNQRLLLAIPLYLFLFAIYYAVSALAGVLWRNAIVSVVLTVVFWLVCWTLGTATQLVEALSLNGRRFVTVVPAGETLIAVNTQGEVYRWDESEWQKIFVARGENQMPFMLASRLAGPVYDASGERILSFKTGPPGFSPLQAANKLLIGKRQDDWRRAEGVNLPDGAHALLLGPAGEVLIASSQGVSRLEGDSEAKQQDINVFGLHIPLPEKGGRFVSVGPRVQLRPLQSAAMDPQTGVIALFDGHRLLLFARDDKGNYQQSKVLSFETRKPGEVALGGGKLFLALADGEIQTYDLDLKPGEVISTGVSSAPEQAVVSPDGRYLAIVFRNANLWLYDISQQRPSTLSIAGQGDISAVAFAADKMFTADRLTRISQYDLAKDELNRTWQGDMPLAEKIYRYALHPLYTVFPKPGQLNTTVMYVLTSSDAPIGGARFNNQSVAPLKVDIWGPVWSNLAFLAVVLVITCIVVARKDF